MKLSKIARKIAGVPCLYSPYTEGKLAWQKEEEKAGGPNVDPHLMSLSDFLPSVQCRRGRVASQWRDPTNISSAGWSRPTLTEISHIRSVLLM